MLWAWLKELEYALFCYLYLGPSRYIFRICAIVNTIRSQIRSGDFSEGCYYADKKKLLLMIKVNKIEQPANAMACFG
jgi:hypothetical protein